MHLSDFAETLPRYRDWAPSQHDTKGLGLPDRQDWIVAPHSLRRDAGCLARSNFAVAQRMLDEAGATYEVHRFGHWGPWWFEIILVHPDWAEQAAGLVCADYPVLDDSHLSELESEEEWECWQAYGAHDFVRELAEVFGLSDAAVDVLTGEHSALFEFHGRWDPGTDHTDEGPDFNFGYVAHDSGPTRDDVAALIRSIRKAVRP